MRDSVIRGELRGHVSASEADEGSLVAHLVAVVGRAEDRHAVPVMLNLVPFVLHLQAKNEGWSKSLAVSRSVFFVSS